MDELVPVRHLRFNRRRLQLDRPKCIVCGKRLARVRLAHWTVRCPQCLRLLAIDVIERVGKFVPLGTWYHVSGAGFGRSGLRRPAEDELDRQALVPA